jgi:hypothetical protein
MIDELQKKLPKYGRQASHARCFLHMTNLIAKSLISMFDIKKKKDSWLEDLKSADGLEREIEELSEDMDQDEQAMVAESEGSNVNEGADNTEGLVNIVEEMGPEERTAHEGHVQPVTLVLVKV